LVQGGKRDLDDNNRQEVLHYRFYFLLGYYDAGEVQLQSGQTSFIAGVPPFRICFSCPYNQGVAKYAQELDLSNDNLLSVPVRPRMTAKDIILSCQPDLKNYNL
jgi:hypothetical protein